MLKRSKYAKIAPPSTPPPASVIPFVMEASCCLLSLFSFVSAQPSRISGPNFLNRSPSYALSSGKMLRMAFDSERQAPPTAPQEP